MKIRVQHENGKNDVIDIQDPTIRVGVELDVLKSWDGTEHFFTKDGYMTAMARSRPQ